MIHNIYECDRCSEKYSEAQIISNTKEVILTKTSIFNRNYDLCNSCYKIFNDLVKKFLRNKG